MHGKVPLGSIGITRIAVKKLFWFGYVNRCITVIPQIQNCLGIVQLQGYGRCGSLLFEAGSVLVLFAFLSIFVHFRFDTLSSFSAMLFSARQSFSIHFSISFTSTLC